MIKRKARPAVKASVHAHKHPQGTAEGLQDWSRNDACVEEREELVCFPRMRSAIPDRMAARTANIASLITFHLLFSSIGTGGELEQEWAPSSLGG